MKEAIQRYPNAGRLHFEAGGLAEEIGKKKSALRHYKRAVEIEDEYRRVFREMYPGREMFSRLGEDKYRVAKQKISGLSEF